MANHGVPAALARRHMQTSPRPSDVHATLGHATPACPQPSTTPAVLPVLKALAAGPGRGAELSAERSSAPDLVLARGCEHSNSRNVTRVRPTTAHPGPHAPPDLTHPTELRAPAISCLGANPLHYLRLFPLWSWIKATAMI